jgi:hypothetical protein
VKLTWQLTLNALGRSMIIKRSVLLLITACGLSSCRASQAQELDSTPVLACFTAQPALTYSFTGAPEGADTSWSVVQTLPDGSVRRPMLRASLDRRSNWSLIGDTLALTVHDGVVGWRLMLTRRPGGWVGSGTYLTDAIVKNAKPAQRVFTLTRRTCRGSA